MRKETSKNYEIRPFSVNRRLLSDYYDEMIKTHHVKGLVEVDVTKGRELIKNYEKNNCQKLSFTSWLVKCVSQAVNDHKMIHALRKGRKKVIIFDEIDISIMIEREINNKKFPVNHVIRNTQTKSVQEISKEIEKAKKESISESNQLIGKKRRNLSLSFFLILPKFIRRQVYQRMSTKNPFAIKKLSGTVLITSVGMFGKNRGGWAITFGIHTLNIVVGGITKKPGIINDEIVIREYLSLTLMINHDIVDGGPATRFVARLMELIEEGYAIN